MAKSTPEKPGRQPPAHPAVPKGRPAKPTLLAGGNPQIAKAYGDAPVQAYIAAMPGWKSDVGRRLDALIVRTVPGVRKAVKWNSPLLRRRGPGLVPQLSLLHEVRQGGVLPRRVAASCPARRVQAQGRALPRHPRGRPARRSSVRRLGEASQPIARRTNVSGEVARCVRGVSGRQVIGPQASRLPGWGQGLKTATAANRPRRPHLELSCPEDIVKICLRQSWGGANMESGNDGARPAGEGRRMLDGDELGCCSCCC